MTLHNPRTMNDVHTPTSSSLTPKPTGGDAPALDAAGVCGSKQSPREAGETP